MTRKLIVVALTTLLFGAVYATAGQLGEPAPVGGRTPAALHSDGIAPASSYPDRVTLQVAIQEPVEIPGRVLLPGTYELRFTDSNTVLVSTASGRGLGFLNVMPASRKVATSDIKFVLDEVPGTSVPKLAAWYLPNELRGFAIRYPNAKQHSGKAAQP